MVDTGQVATAQIMVLNELRVLCVWLGCNIGLLSGKHAHVITSAPFMAANVNVKHALYRAKLFTTGLKLIDLLEDMCVRQEVRALLLRLEGAAWTTGEGACGSGAHGALEVQAWAGPRCTGGAGVCEAPG